MRIAYGDLIGGVSGDMFVAALLDLGLPIKKLTAELKKIPTLEFKPGVHVHYQETRLPIKDGLPKMKDMPKEMGGSGVTLAE